ncbi:hypothetical protein M514_02086 [Trichuris suis]|uniref:Uncharacterized protein n=1 Tax=Trichuris suis TaxID=68888 RepID=A0A085N1K9_9BILA|nr:hypothetical protein M513_02086 [Trichuris suis]KFD63355.1 hypothetical protein M514_02086 [Trichuris suis]
MYGQSEHEENWANSKAKDHWISRQEHLGQIKLGSEWQRSLKGSRIMVRLIDQLCWSPGIRQPTGNGHQRRAVSPNGEHPLGEVVVPRKRQPRR